jgi:hypothetical protein
MSITTIKHNQSKLEHNKRVKGIALPRNQELRLYVKAEKKLSSNSSSWLSLP